MKLRNRTQKKLREVLGMSAAATLLAGAGVITLAPAAHAAGPRPDFQLPFPCDQRWRINSYDENHAPALDMVREPQSTTAGSQVVAPADGVVVRSNFDPEPGNVVQIDHGGSWFSTVIHLQSRAVAAGTRVYQGQAIGRVGQTGSTSNETDHLHYELAIDANGDGRASFGNANTERVPAWFEQREYGGRPNQEWRNVVSSNCGPNSQLTAAVRGGGLFHTMRFGRGNWSPFGDVEAATRSSLQPIDTASATQAGEQHLVVAAEDGELWHALRHADGSWTPFGNVEDLAGEVGSFVRVAAAPVGGDLHVAVLTTGGTVMHTTRRGSDGTWTPLLSVEDYAGPVDNVLDLAAAGFRNNSFQLAVSLEDGRLLHTERNPSTGQWTGFADVEAAANSNPGAPQSIAAAGIGNSFHIILDYGSAGVRHTERYPDGSWAPISVINPGSNPGPAVDVAAAGMSNGDLQVAVASNTGPLWHAIRSPNGGWTPYGETKAFEGDPGQITRITFAGN